MGVNIQRFLLGLFLLACPVLLVLAIKQTSWGPILAAPQARQTGDPTAKVVIVEYPTFNARAVPGCILLSKSCWGSTKERSV